MKAVCETLGVAGSNIAERSKGRGSGRRGRPPEPDGELVAGIEEVIKGLPTYGYRRVHAVLRRSVPGHQRTRSRLPQPQVTTAIGCVRIGSRGSIVIMELLITAG